MTTETIPLTFACGSARLVGLMHLPAQAKPLGVVIVVGTPQYRVGSHRQFVLLARDLATAGFPVFRFDYRGMGDSDGEFAGFEGVDDDIRAAVDSFFDRVPRLREVVLWGLCDGASASSFFAHRDRRVSGMILVNPWVRSEVSLAQARVRHYYRGRLLSGDFWRRLFTGKIDLGGTACEVTSSMRQALTGRTGRRDGEEAATLAVRVARSLRAFPGRVLVVLSGEDMTAQEFDAAVLRSAEMDHWSERPTVTLRRLNGANHTYATATWRRQVHDWTVGWLEQGL